MDGQEKDTEKSIEWGAMLKMREGVVKMGGLRDLRKEKLSKNLIYRKIYCFTILLFTQKYPHRSVISMKFPSNFMETALQHLFTKKHL